MSNLKEKTKTNIDIIQVSQKTILKKHKWGRDKEKDNALLDSYHESMKLIKQIKSEIKSKKTDNEKQIEFLQYKIKSHFDKFSKFFV